MDEIEQAIREAVQETIAELGIDAAKALSWFPSNGAADNRESLDALLQTHMSPIYKGFEQ